MAGVYRHFILYFCFYAMICSVAGENLVWRQGRENFEVTANLTNLNTNAVRVSHVKYTTTTQNPNSEVLNSAAVKNVASFLVSTSLPVSSSSTFKNQTPDPDRKAHRFSIIRRDLTGQFWEQDDARSQSAPETLDPEEVEQRNSLAKTEQRSNLEEIEQRNNLEEAEEKNNLTENEMFPNNTMKEINGSLNVENTTMAANEMLMPGTIVPVLTTLETTEGYTRKRNIPTPFEPPQAKKPELHSEKLESRASSCSMPLMFMWLLCLCRWIF